MNIELLSKKIIEFWFRSCPNPYKDLWFQSNKTKRDILDKTLTDDYGELLIFLETININSVTSMCLEIQVSIIICLDQFSRHIYRHNVNDNMTKIIDNTAKASDIALHICENSDLSKCHEFVPFILMPLKHADIFKYFPVIHTTVSDIFGNVSDMPKYVSLFYFNSLEKYLLHHRQYSNIITNTTNDTTNDTTTILKQPDLLIKSVCEYFPPDVIGSNKMNITGILYTIVSAFLKKIIDRTSIIRPAVNNLIIVSLSGGPDSMVLLYILKLLRKSYNIRIEAFHINYKNRPESDIEEQFVSYYCKAINIKVHIYRFTYINRNTCDREFYERITRSVRFNLYRHFNAPIVLGHIADDLVENIWTNISKGENLFKLHKIDPIAYQDDIYILRPFHRINKEDIYTFAHKYNIPYLKNTTPTWSNRGKLRNEFQPAVESQFGKNVNDKLLYLSDSLVSYHKLLDKCIFKPLLDSAKYHKFGVCINISNFLEMELHFWQYIMMRLVHSLHISMVSIKSVKNFVTALHNNKRGVIHLKKNYSAYIDGSINLHILDIDKITKFLNKSTLVYNDWIYIISQINNYID